MVCSLQWCSDTEWHLGYVLLVDIPPWETCCWLIFQQQHSVQANPRAAMAEDLSGLVLGVCALLSPPEQEAAEPGSQRIQ